MLYKIKIKKKNYKFVKIVEKNPSSQSKYLYCVEMKKSIAKKKIIRWSFKGKYSKNIKNL